MIQLQEVTITAGAFTLSRISGEIPTGCYGVLMGKSGAGKTTLLEAICGLNPVTGGRILLHGRDVTALPPAQRGIGFVPQDGALFPTMPVREQLSFPLRIRRWSTTTMAERIDELAALLGITALLDRLPDRLSGGEAQRVALGRALAARPRVLCLDEPLNALDAATHTELCLLLRQVTAHTGVTALHVTHNQQEARHLADVCLSLEDGTLTPLALEGRNMGVCRECVASGGDAL